MEPRDGASYKHRPKVSNGPVYGMGGAPYRPHANFFSYGGLLFTHQVVSTRSNKSVHSWTGEHGNSK